ncbi:hypothetical protein [Dyadobacter luticola]|uniref:Uncharacterized protein n=1 Tax=Dyadobacter luticola TaxID=1979387 RepID=A0A5R9L4B0_9BACT|nr:hypothetical protein [Dyadobacter luticola]TLV03217.1 hypothetical protein FEN17_06295 [Dyadobacter luticola]
MQELRAGNIEVGYQNGFLRYFKAADTEVLRMIYFAVRNAHWENWEPVITDEVVMKNVNTFKVTCTASYYEQGELFFQFQIRIQGLEYNEIQFEIVGQTLKDFQTNRAGFCILHPIEHIAGFPVTVLHSDNEEKTYHFPNQIAPHQPFIDINSMQWKVGESEFRLEMQGDIFEIEDQRNWGDASYKTYCTPLSIPFPKTIKAGDKIFQKVTFKASLVETQPVITEENASSRSNRVKVGICAGKIPAACATSLAAVRWDHYRVEVDFASPAWEQDFLIAANQARMLGTSLEISVQLGAEFKNELQELAELVNVNAMLVSSLILLSKDALVTSQPVIDYIPKLRYYFNEVEIGIGTAYNFTEINRNRFDAGEADFIALSFDPQEHASDDLTILENAATLKYMAESIRELFGKPVHFSPIMLKRRFNPYATDKNEVVLPLQKQLDARQKTEFLAEWVKMIFKELEKTEVRSVTMFQGVGALGLMDEEGNAYPVFEVIHDYATRNQ